MAAQNTAIVEQMKASYEAWWSSVVPMMVNETAPLAAENPFWTLYRKQFGTLRSSGPAADQKRRVQDDK